MKHGKEYSDHATPRHQEKEDRDHLQPEIPILIEQEEEPNGFTMEEEPQIHPHRLFENTNDKEAW